MDKTRSEDRMLLRARKPHFKKIERSLSLNFGGRVKKASRKNIQIVSIKNKLNYYRNINLKEMIS